MRDAARAPKAPRPRRAAVPPPIEDRVEDSPCFRRQEAHPRHKREKALPQVMRHRHSAKSLGSSDSNFKEFLTIPSFPPLVFIASHNSFAES